MTDTKNQTVVGSGVNPVVAAVAGAVVAGAVVAGAMAMADKDNQDKVKEVVDSGVDKAKKLETIAKRAIDDAKNI